MSTALKLYLDLLSPPCRSIFIILKKSGTAFEEVPVALRKGEHLKSEFKEVNRFQKVPCIADGNFKLAESLAILSYLSSTNRISESLYTSDVKGRAKIDEFLAWNLARYHEGAVNYFRLDWQLPFITGKPTSEADLAKGRKSMEQVFDLMENLWLGSGKFVAGNRVTAADVFGVCDITQGKLTDYDVSKRYPKIGEWIENVRHELNPDFDEAHKFIYKFAKNH